MMSSAPDTSATRHGPVPGGPKPGEVEAAKTQAPAPAGASIAVETVGEEALKSGKAVDTKSTETDGSQPTAGSEKTSGAQPGADAATSSQTSDPEPPIKKKKKSFIKKLLPF